MIDESVLDDAEALAAADPAGTLRALAGAGAQVRRALELADDSALSRWEPQDRPRAVVVAARGGSAVVADAVAALVGAAGAVPVVHRSGGALPAWVGPLDLLVATSLSGGAEGPVALTREAGRRGAAVLTVGAASSPLAEVSAATRGVHVPLPEPGREATSAPTTRTATWSLLTPVLRACERLGLLGGPTDLEAVADLLDAEAEACRPSSEAFVNPAKVLARELDESVPVLLGLDDVGAVAARRAATVLSRTARVPAVHGALPDDAGDVVATFGGPFAARAVDDLFADPLADPLGDGRAGPRTLLRLVLLGPEQEQVSWAVRRIADEAGVRTSEVRADAATPLGRLAQLVARVDFAATYLALATGCDPASSPHVADLRDALRGGWDAGVRPRV
ncbi:SIS domain-containing protein [Thalassiella azotivora]